MSWKNKPFLLSPAGKDYLWGGDRLNTDFHKKIDMTPLAETWECSTHPDGASTVASGEHRGKTLHSVLAEHPEYLGSHPIAVMQGLSAGAQDPPPGAANISAGIQDSPSGAPGLSANHPNYGQLPILVKLIDAAQDLSVQVHPDDGYANVYENGALGKTEMWYVLDAAPGAHLVYGFNRDMDEELLRRSLRQGTIEKYLQKVPVQKDDVFYIEAGTIHAIGAGVLLAEVQENSNLTYRLYDYDRADKRGQKRPLHIEKALQVLHYKSSESPRQPMRVLRYRPGCASELLCRCKYFQVERMLVNTHASGTAWNHTGSECNAPDCTTTEHSFQVLLCLEGEGELILEGEERLPFSRGNCMFLPADSVPIQLRGKAQLLRIGC